MNRTKPTDECPACAYCGDRPAQSRKPGGSNRYRGRPACLACRDDFETGRRPAPPRLLPGGDRSRNGRSERQRYPVDPTPDWDDAVRAVEDARSD